MIAARLVRGSHHIIRYGLAASGPFAGAAAQFLLALVLIAVIDPATFGRFSFLMVLSQFALGLWSALFSAPLVVATAHNATGREDAAAIVATSLLALLPVSAILWVVSVAGGAGNLAACVYALFASLLLARQVGRTGALAGGRVLRSVMSDLLFAAAGLVGAALFFVHPPTDLSFVFMPLLAGTVLGLIPLWTLLVPARPAPVAVDQVDRSAPAWSTRLKDNIVATALARTLYNVRGYRLVWQRDSRWSVVGVIATELTVNSHAYAITILIGPAAFAPIAAAALFIRPVTVLINALNEFERARFARAIHSGHTSCLLRERRTFRTTLVSAWALIFAGSLIILLCAPRFLPHQDYDRAGLFTLVIIWFAIALARCLHTPDGALLQAQGQFRMLAGISIWTAGLSVVAVIAGLWLFGPVWSLVGILTGEGAYAAVLLKRGYRLTRQLAQNRSEEGV